MNTIFKNPFGQIRSGWRIALFVLFCAVTFTLAFLPIVLRLYAAKQFELGLLSLLSVLAGTWLAVKFVEKRPFAGVGLAINRQAMRQLAIGVLVGWLMMTAIFGFEYANGWVKVEMPDFSFDAALGSVGLALLFFGFAAMFEEVFVRGYMMQVLAQGIGIVWASILTAILFSFLHVANPNVNAFAYANIVLVGIVFALAYWRTRSLWLPFGIHFSWNFAQTTLYGFRTSGQDFTHYELTKLTQFGPEWLTGGAFGPEAGALATLMIVLCGVYVFFSRSLQSSQPIVLEPQESRLTAQVAGRTITA
jgi:uncharacterized protein